MHNEIRPGIRYKRFKTSWHLMEKKTRQFLHKCFWVLKDRKKESFHEISLKQRNKQNESNIILSCVMNRIVI